MPVDPSPLSARSVALSLLLGAHPGRLSAAQLVRGGEHVGVPASTTRVALTRAVAAGDLVRDGGHYVLGERLAARQRRQDEAVLDAERPWNGSWELAVVVVAGRGGAERSALRERLAAHRLAELREGVWTRPANLRRERGYLDEAVLSTFTAMPDLPGNDPATLAASLWDLRDWATRGERLLALLADSRQDDPAARLGAAAALVRHLAADPLLPPPLLPRDWPAGRMREAYAAYQAELLALAAG